MVEPVEARPRRKSKKPPRSAERTFITALILVLITVAVVIVVIIQTLLNHHEVHPRAMTTTGDSYSVAHELAAVDADTYSFLEWTAVTKQTR